jgi:hypothetical protein
MSDNLQPDHWSEVMMRMKTVAELVSLAAAAVWNVVWAMPRGREGKFSGNQGAAFGWPRLFSE